MMPKPTCSNETPDTSASTDTQLLDQAMALCRKMYENPDDELLQGRVEQWQKQSTAHRESWHQAQVFWLASARIKPQFEESGFYNRLSLALQIKAEVVRELIAQQVENWKAGVVIGVPIMLTALLLCAVLINPSMLSKSGSAPEPVAAITTQYQTAWQQRREITLVDGTLVHLNWNTQISVSMSDQKRHIVLHHGEAKFSVAPDKARPFTVEAQGVSATAIGTAFVVQTTDTYQAKITVSEGVVEAKSPSAAPVRLTLNQQIISSPTAMGEIVSVDANTQNAWQQGMLVFRDRPLLEVLAELDRYTSFDVEPGFIFDTDRRVTGTYFTERADDALRLIALAFDLELEQQAGNKVVIKSAQLERPR